MAPFRPSYRIFPSDRLEVEVVHPDGARALVVGKLDAVPESAGGRALRIIVTDARIAPLTAEWSYYCPPSSVPPRLWHSSRAAARSARWLSGYTAMSASAVSAPVLIGRKQRRLIPGVFSMVSMFDPNASGPPPLAW
jgi:hypothetical protein